MSAEAERWWRHRNDTAWPRADRMKEAGDAVAAALEAREREHDAAIGRMVGEIEARDRRIAELEAGLRDIADGEVSPWYAPTIARDLAGRVAAAEHPSGFPHGQSAGKSPRPEPVAAADLVAQLRAEVAWDTASEDGTTTLILDAAKALEDTAAERDRAHATLRTVAQYADDPDVDGRMRNLARLARDRLANP